MIRPFKIASASDIAGKDAFFLPSGQVDAWFERRSDILIVTFYNLATVGEHELPHPWFYGHIAKQGYSVLGLIAKRKDWYRNEDTSQIIVSLREAGLFAGFRRVLFVGASMGGFAALTYSKLVPGSGVLAFSPQSTLAPEIVPFENRYSRQQKRFDWSSPNHLDAVDAIAYARDVTIVFDPFVPEDKAHAKRLVGQNVTFLNVGHMGHQAIRALKQVGVLSPLFAEVAEKRFDRSAFFRELRGRRQQLRWLRECFRAAEKRNHHRLLLGAANAIEPLDQRMGRYQMRVQKRMTDHLNRRKDHVITISDPAPDGVFTGRIDSLSNALIVPNLPDNPPNSFGVLHENGTWCETSRSWMEARLKSKYPVLPDSAEIHDLPGTYLFGGYYRGHFGHFLVEAASRLWGLDHIPIKPEGIIYIAHGSADRQKLNKYQSFYKALGVNIPVRAFDSVMRIEHLYVPELGFGWGNRFDGSPPFRDFVRNRLTQSIDAAGADNLYVSRSKLWGYMGQVIGEQVLERNLERLGYEVFHPQEHSIEVQLAKYKAARRIVALDGSALHLVPFILPEGRKAAIIKRRSSANIEDYEAQFRAFCGLELDIIDTLRQDWLFNQKGRVDFRAVGELNFVATFQALANLGYIPSEFSPDLPTEEELSAFREQAINQRDGKLFCLEKRAR